MNKARTSYHRKTGLSNASLFCSILLFFIFPLQVYSQQNSKTEDSIKNSNLNNNLVLIHGLTNRHPWSEDFLDRALSLWGSKHVFVVYTNSSETTYRKLIQSKTIFYCGKDNSDAGDASIEKQVELLHRKIQILQTNKILGKKFYIIAHSMGGLVARRYIYKYPNVVKGLVTLGTPHHGSPLADNFEWAGFFLGATDAINNLRPSFVQSFNDRFPIKTSPLADNGKIYTIRGDCDGYDCFGWAGELLFGWALIKLSTGSDSDGLVPFDSAVIEYANHIGDFPEFSHIDLVEEPSVVEKASEYLLNTK